VAQSFLIKMVATDPVGWIFKQGSDCRAELCRYVVGERDEKVQFGGEVVVSEL
jgi:hypothetical protein